MTRRPSDVPIRVSTEPLPDAVVRALVRGSTVADSGNALPDGWVRGTCGCGAAQLVNTDGRCVDCAAGGGAG